MFSFPQQTIAWTHNREKNLNSCYSLCGHKNETINRIILKKLNLHITYIHIHANYYYKLDSIKHHCVKLQNRLSFEIAGVLKRLN